MFSSFLQPAGTCFPSLDEPTRKNAPARKQERIEGWVKPQPESDMANAPTP